jgi:membrane associated rhomboid family serine protease
MQAISIKRWITIYGASILTGGITQLGFNRYHKTDRPCLGASAGVNGLVLYTAARFPQANFALLFIPVPARIAAGLIFGWDALNILSDSSSNGSTAHASHVGGALCGLILFKRWN